MQSKPDQNSKPLGEPALSSARMQAIREAARRVTLELLQQQQAAQTPISQAQEAASNDGQIAEPTRHRELLRGPEPDSLLPSSPY